MFALSRDDGYTISTDPGRINLDLVHTWLATDAYWALGRDRETVVRSKVGYVPVRPEHWMELDRRSPAVSPLTGKDPVAAEPLTVEP